MGASDNDEGLPSEDFPAEDLPPEPGLKVRRSALLAGAAFLLLATALLLSWWSVTNRLDGLETSEGVGLWSSGAEMARPQAVWVTAALAVLPLPILFVRVAARSWVHEVKSWRRDLGVCLALALAAAVSCWFWPYHDGGWFWGTEWFSLPDGGMLVVEQAPGAGWWLALLAAGLLAWAWLWSRRADAGQG